MKYQKTHSENLEKALGLKRTLWKGTLWKALDHSEVCEIPLTQSELVESFGLQ